MAGKSQSSGHVAIWVELGPLCSWLFAPNPPFLSHLCLPGARHHTEPGGMNKQWWSSSQLWCSFINLWTDFHHQGTQVQEAIVLVTFSFCDKTP